MTWYKIIDVMIDEFCHKFILLITGTINMGAIPLEYNIESQPLPKVN